MRLVLVLSALLLFAGCAEPGTDTRTPTPPASGGAFHVGGSFDAQATQQDYDRAEGIAASYGGTLALLESFPVQFSATGFTDVACQKARDALSREPHVASVGGCAPQSASASPETPTSSPAALPPIASLRNASDRFLVDFDVIASGHPFKGSRAADPHAGAHVHFDNAAGEWPRNGTEWPAIYAVADGVVARVDRSYHVGDNDRYGIALRIADGWVFGYSIEPFVPEPSPHFYETFILVKEGQRVTKGQVIARMYLPRLAQGPHVHFDLSSTAGGFAAPAIFTPDVVAKFHDRWGEFGRDGQGGPAMPACMGWKLAAAENPFGTGALDCL